MSTDLIATAMDVSRRCGRWPCGSRHHIGDLHVSIGSSARTRRFPKPVDVGEVIEFYNRTLADLPDHTRLKGMRLPGMSEVLDSKASASAEVYEPDQRRSGSIWLTSGHVRSFRAAETSVFFSTRDRRSAL